MKLLTETEYQAAMQRIEALMGDTEQKPGGELDTLADEVVAYEALDDAALALIANMRVYTATRADPKLRAAYRKRAEVVVRAWLGAIAAQSNSPTKAGEP